MATRTSGNAAEAAGLFTKADELPRHGTATLGDLGALDGRHRESRREVILSPHARCAPRSSSSAFRTERWQRASSAQ